MTGAALNCINRFSKEADWGGSGFVESVLEGVGPSVIEKGYKIGISSDFWNRYEEDIQLAQDLGAHASPARLLHVVLRVMPPQSERRLASCVPLDEPPQLKQPFTARV